MCVVSMVGDHYRRKWEHYPLAPWQVDPNDPYNPYQPQIVPNTNPLPSVDWADLINKMTPVTREEFDDLKKEILEMKELLKRAKRYDEDNDEPECEIDEKMDLLRKVAKLVGVDLNDVIPEK